MAYLNRYDFVCRYTVAFEREISLEFAVVDSDVALFEKEWKRLRRLRKPIIIVVQARVERRQGAKGMRRAG